MAGKKWCDYCRINLPYGKKEIQQHEETRNHLENKRKSIKFQRMKVQKQQRQQRQAKSKTALLSTANVPKAKKGSQLEKQVRQYREDIISQGKSAIHNLIAARTLGKFGAPIQFPDKEDLVLAENCQSKAYNQHQSNEGDDDSQQQLEMWRIDICQQTGEACFINNVTKTKLFEPPKGHILSANQKQEWQHLQEICKDKVALAGDDTVNISEWQQVADEDNYFVVNQIKQQSEEHEQTLKQQPVSSRKNEGDTNLPRTNANKPKAEEKDEPAIVRKSWMQKLQQRVNNNEADANQIFETVLYNKLKECKSIKEKNDTLKNLIKNDFQIRQTIEQRQTDPDLKLQSDKQAVSFKPKKKIKTAKLVQESDIY